MFVLIFWAYAYGFDYTFTAVDIADRASCESAYSEIHQTAPRIAGHVCVPKNMRDK